jgi:hypothetical protein
VYLEGRSEPLSDAQRAQQEGWARAQAEGDPYQQGFSFRPPAGFQQSREQRWGGQPLTAGVGCGWPSWAQPGLRKNNLPNSLALVV